MPTALGAGGDEASIREMLIKNNKVEAIFVLPREMFYSTDISVTLWIINNNKHARVLNGRNVRERSEEVLFVDLRRWTQNTYDKGYIMFSPEQIQEIVALYQKWQSVDFDSATFNIPEYCCSVKKKKIAATGYSLVPSKYIEFVDRDLGIDYEPEMARIQETMRTLIADEKKSQAKLEQAFRGIGYGIE